ASDPRNRSLWVRKKDFPRYEAVEYQNFLKHRFSAPDPRNGSLWVRKKDFPRYEAASNQYLFCAVISLLR
ncbi:MAG: hypothetical protein UH083_04195, partial [Ruminococcus sp.]|nr:hypothetical protein [Ruminococcus sp.]